LVTAIEDGPIPAIHGGVRWRVIDLCQWLWDGYDVKVSPQTLSALRQIASGRDRARAGRRPRRRRGLVRRRSPCRPEEQDYPALGPPGGLPGTRPSAPQDQRTASTYIFGVICPETVATAGLILPWCNADAIGQHLAVIAAQVTAGKHCALLVDQAGWHLSARLVVQAGRTGWSYRLVVPANITIVPLPPKCPELNPVKNVWQFIRNNWLSNRVFASYDAIVDHCCDGWNRLADQPWRVMSIGLRDWATGHSV